MGAYLNLLAKKPRANQYKIYPDYYLPKWSGCIDSANRKIGVNLSVSRERILNGLEFCQATQCPITCVMGGGKFATKYQNLMPIANRFTSVGSQEN